MDTLHALTVVIGYPLQMIFFGYALFLATKGWYPKATFCLSLSIFLFLVVRLQP